jgi:hypothetical protein
MYLWRSGKDAPAQRPPQLELASVGCYRHYPITAVVAVGVRHSCDGNRSSPVRICDAALFHAAFHAHAHAADLEEIIVASHHRESGIGVDLAPLCIAIDTKIIRQREVHHFAPSAVIEPRYLT